MTKAGPVWRRFQAGLADERGAAAIEFAVVVPLFLSVIFIAVVFSIYLTTFIGVSQAAAEGARASVAGLDAAERQTLALGRVNAVISGYSPLLSTAKVQITYPTAATGLFSVKVSYPVAELKLASFAPFSPVPAVSPARTVTVTTGGY